MDATCSRASPLPFSRRRTRPIFRPWRRNPTLPKNPAKPPNPNSKSKAPNSKAHRPDVQPIGPALAELLNPAINRGDAGLGSGTGLQPPPDNSWDRRAGGEAAAHRARASTRGTSEDVAKRDASPASTKRRKPITAPSATIPTLDPELARQLGLPTAEDDDEALARPPRNKMEALGVKATADALENLIRDGRPEFRRRRRPAESLDAAPPAAPGEIRRRRALRDQVRIRAEGRPADRDRRTGRGHPAQRPHAGAARRHRLRQDLHHGQGDRGDAAPCHHPRAEQDAGRAALWRVQELLPRQRGGVFRQLLRLLPARSLCAAHRHLHRKGLVDQRADRPHAPLGDARAAGARRRHHRRLGVVHLRYRLGRDLYRDDLCAEEGRAHRPAAVDRRPRRAAIQAHPGRFHPRHLSRARRRHRHLPGAL